MNPSVNLEILAQSFPASWHTLVRALHVCSAGNNPGASFRRASNNQTRVCLPLFSNHRARVAPQTLFRNVRTWLAAFPLRVPGRAHNHWTLDHMKELAKWQVEERHDDGSLMCQRDEVIHVTVEPQT